MINLACRIRHRSFMILYSVPSNGYKKSMLHIKENQPLIQLVSILQKTSTNGPEKLGSNVSEVIARFEDTEGGFDSLLLRTVSGGCYILHNFLFYPLGHDIASVQASLIDIGKNGLEKRAFLDPYHWIDICKKNEELLAARHL